MKKTHIAITTVAVIIVILIIAAGYIDHDFKTYHELNTKKNILSGISDNGKIIELYEQPDYFIVVSAAPEKPRNIKLQYFERKILWYYRTSFTSPVYEQDNFYKDASWQYRTENGLGMYLVAEYGILEKPEAFVQVTYDDDTEKTIKPDKDGYFFKVEEMSAKSFRYSPETYVKWAKAYDEKGKLLETQMHWTDNRDAINSEGISESVHQLLRQDNKGLQTKQGYEAMIANDDAMGKVSGVPISKTYFNFKYDSYKTSDLHYVDPKISAWDAVKKQVWEEQHELYEAPLALIHGNVRAYLEENHMTMPDVEQIDAEILDQAYFENLK